MTTYTHQARATREFGITFRSKLEATWAYAFQDLAKKIRGVLDEEPEEYGWLEEVKWEYVDSPWHDFTLSYGETPCAKLEIKPIGDAFVDDAIKRIPDGESVIVLQGEPKGVEFYGIHTCINPIAFHISSSSIGVCHATWNILEPQAMWQLLYLSSVASQHGPNQYAAMSNCKTIWRV